METTMAVQYLTDESGKPIAVVIPIEQWEALQSEFEEEKVTEEELKDAERGWNEYLSGKGENLKSICNELLNE